MGLIGFSRSHDIFYLIVDLQFLLMTTWIWKYLKSQSTKGVMAWYVNTNYFFLWDYNGLSYFWPSSLLTSAKVQKSILEKLKSYKSFFSWQIFCLQWLQWIKTTQNMQNMLFFTKPMLNVIFRSNGITEMVRKKY